MKKIKHNKINYLILFLSFVLILLVFYLIFFNIPKKINQRAILYRSNELGQFSLTWVSDNKSKNKGIIDENDHNILNVSPTENNVYNVYNNPEGGAQVTYQLVFNMGGSEEAPIGAIQLKIPKDVFFGRDGNPIAEQVRDIPLVAYPEAAGTGFNFRFETDEEDGKDYIILENYQIIPASYAFECSLTWILPTPSTVADGYTKTITGTATLDMDLDGEPDLESTSNTLTMNYSSHANINGYSESYYTHVDPNSGNNVNVYENWNNSWKSSIKPENAEDYVYAIWYSSGNVYYATQPYTTTITSRVTDDLGGEVIGYCNNYYHYNESSCFASTNTRSDKYEYSTIQKPDRTYNEFRYTFFLVKYPKETLCDGEEHTLMNESTMTINGLDGALDSKTSSSSVKYKYVYVAPTTIEKTTGFNPSYANYISKGGSGYVYGGINALEANKKVFAGYSKSNSSYYNYTTSTTLSAYKLTLKENGDETNPEDYGVNEWKAVHTDDTLILGEDPNGYELLEETDYEFTDFSISGYSANKYVYKTWSSTNPNTKVTTVTTGWTTESINYNSLPPIKIYYKKNGEWIYYADVNYNSSGSSYFDYQLADETRYTKVSSTSLINGKYGIPLPEGVSGIKAEISSKYYSVGVSFVAHVNLLPTEHVKSIIEEKDSVRLYNYNSSYAVDYQGNIQVPPSSNSYNREIPQNLKGIVDQKDQDDYGMNVLHYHYYATQNSTYKGTTGYYDLYTRINNGETKSDKWVKYTSDTANRRIQAEYTAIAYESVPYNTEVLTSDEVVEYNVIKEQRVGTFYDLLPLGMTINNSSVKVETLIIKSLTSTTVSNPDGLSPGTEIPVSISKIENWQGSGRTMVVIKATLPSDAPGNYIDRGNTSDKRVISGMVLKFTGYYDWDRIPDYGNTLLNTIAYKSGSGELSNGYADDSSALSNSYTDKGWFIDLDQDGNEIAMNDTVYAQRSGSFSFNTASDSSFKKAVKTPNIDDYTDGKDGSAIASAGGYYTYRLRYASQKNLTTTDLVIYDILEDYDYENSNRWKGEFVDIDISQPLSKGIQPTIYYSTVNPRNLNIYEKGKASIDQSLPNDINDLENNTKWSTTPPEDKSKITAIAIDLSKKADGTPFSLLSEETVVMTVTMQAPIKNAETLEESNAKAYNAAWWSGTTKQGDEPSHFHLSVFEWTEVLLTKPKIEITKDSFVLENNKILETPGIVYYGNELVYDLQIENTSDYESLSKVKLVDNLPKNITPLIDKIAYYYEGESTYENATLLKDSSVVKLNYEDNDLAFEISQLLSKQKIHILIPSNPKIEENKTMENKFELLGYNNKVFHKESNSVTHELQVGTLSIKKKVSGDYRKGEKEFEFKIHLITPERYQELQAIRKDQEAEENSDNSQDNNDNAENSNDNNDNAENNNDNNHDNNDNTINSEGSPSLGKDLVGNEEEKNKKNEQEEITIDEKVNETLGGLKFKNGVASIKIKDGETLEFKDLPAGYHYEVEENDYSKEGFSTTSENKEGTIEDKKTKEVLYINTYIHQNPITATIAQIILIILLLASSIIIATYFTFHPLKKKQSN